MTIFAVLLTLGLVAASQGNNQERPKVPEDSVQLVLIGCLKGRVLAASEVRQPDVQSGPNVGSRSFRLAGKKDVMKDVKREDGHLVEVTGLVKRSALDDRGVKVGKRVTIGGGSPRAGVGAGSMPDPADNVLVMDVWSVRLRSSSCHGSE